MSTGVELIEEEREHQIEEEGYTPEHDQHHSPHDLILAAQAYLMAAKGLLIVGASYWPWESRSFKPSPDPQLNLIKAGALTAAAIDRFKAEGL